MDTADDPVGQAAPTHVHRPGDPSAASMPVWLWVMAARMDQRRIVDTVMKRFVPEIAGLRCDDDLNKLVKRYAFIAYLTALDDPDLEHAHSDERRTVVAGRVALALAFPETARRLGTVEATRPSDGLD
jgi:hypothetical protein